MKTKGSPGSRRDFLKQGGALLAALALNPGWPSPASAQSAGAGKKLPRAQLTLIDPLPDAPIAPGLIGLSYETLQMQNPDFFSADNHALVGMLRGLNPDGILRIGGNTSDFAVWEEYHGALPTYANKPGILFKRPYVITRRQLEQLSGFLRATGWRAIYGLNLKADLPAMAAQLAKATAEILGDRLLAIQIGNESNNFRRADGTIFSYEDYLAQWRRSAAAVRKAVRVPLMGPDTGANTDWVLRFANDEPDAVAVSRHYYKGGASDPATSIADLLAGDAAFLEDVAQVPRALAGRHLPYLLTEANSYYNGGKLGVSNTFASALWGGDFALACARAGVQGINIHSGMLSALEASLSHDNHASAPQVGSYEERLDAISGRYSPIAGDVGMGFYARPLYYGLLLARQFGGGRFLESTLDVDRVNLTTYAAEKEGRRMVAIFNKDLMQDAAIELDAGIAARRIRLWRLEAPSVDELHRVTFAGSSVSHAGAWSPTREEQVAVDGRHARFVMPRTSAVLAFIET